MKDLKLDELTHDLQVTDYDLTFVNGIELVAQQLKIRLWFFHAEWYLDTSVGIRFFEDVLVKNPDLGSIENLLKETILSTPNVNSILEFTLNYDNSLRKLTVTFSVDTTYGILQVSEDL